MRTMWKYHAELLATPVPRYTSYPTAAEFHDGVGEGEHRAALASVRADEDISLYVHIPYCKEICWYCGCNTGAANRPNRLASYLEALFREIELVAGALGGGLVSRIAFGGGSPNALSPSQFLGLVARLRSAFAIRSSAILSVEIDPRSFDQDFAAVLDEAGVERASLGVQTFDPAIQAAIGRFQPFELIDRSVNLLREAGVSSLNFDLMYGLPGQTCAQLADSLQRSSELGADRLAVFGYAHVPHLVPRQRRIDSEALPGAENRFRQASFAFNWLVSRGWQPVGFDHFARPHDPLAKAAIHGRLRRNFQGFTDDPCNALIGLGASAISRLPGLLVQNQRNSGLYALKTGSGHLASMRGFASSVVDLERATAIEELLCNGTTDLGTLPMQGRTLQALRPFETLGLLLVKGSRLTLREAGLPYARTIAALLDPWRSLSDVRFSSAI